MGAWYYAMERRWRELLDLQNRFHLLEGDRKAFYEQSQLTLKQNKEICDTLRQENKDLRMALSSINKERGGGAETNAMQDAEAAKIEAQLSLLRQRQNQLQHANRSKESSMSQLDDELRSAVRRGTMASTGSPVANGLARCGSAASALGLEWCWAHNHATGKLSARKLSNASVRPESRLARQRLTIAMCLPGSCSVAAGPYALTMSSLMPGNISRNVGHRSLESAMSTAGLLSEDMGAASILTDKVWKA